MCIKNHLHVVGAEMLNSYSKLADNNFYISIKTQIAIIIMKGLTKSRQQLLNQAGVIERSYIYMYISIRHFP